MSGESRHRMPWRSRLWQPDQRGRQRRRAVAVGAVILALLAVSSWVPASADPVEPGTRPPAANARALSTTAAPDGLQLMINERGHLSRSIAAVSSDDPAGGTLSVRKPPGATVRGAYLAVATTGFSSTPLADPVAIDGQSVALANEIPTGISSYNYFANVTALVKSKLDQAPAGPVTFTVSEPQPDLVDGEIVVVVFEDPAVTADLTVSVLYGALRPSGDEYRVKLATPINIADPQTRLEMSLGISFSFQTGGTQQYSAVEVNGQRLTSAAGGEDDGDDHNGALITVGGEGDSSDNPTDPSGAPTGPRSDDELYNLMPFVHTGDREITVRTTNPSLDDNVLLATFTMNPPVTAIDTGDQFVYVALGDSYQSGEGAGNSLNDTDAYLTRAYENGFNYPDSVGPQSNTYSRDVTPDGNACHRSLVNYAKLNRDRLASGSTVVLIDLTCSGAKIEPGGKPAVVGTSGSPVVDDASQVAEAARRLASVGLSAADVDLVTVGMGGNDAKFGEIVKACLAPNILRRLVKAYPNPPGEIEFLVDKIVDCQRADDLLFKTGAAIDALADKERWAQTRVLESFPAARVLQLNYPNILPIKKNAPAWCGGIRKEDLDYARQKVAKIDAVVRDTARSAGSRFEIVDVETGFGSNALCPSTVDNTLANGMSEENFVRELRRLLNLDGHGDAVARGLLDKVVSDYRAYKSCMTEHYNPLGGDCNTTNALDRLKASGQAVTTYIASNLDTILANVIAPGDGGESVAVRIDRSRGLFHPNANGYAVLACEVRAGYEHAGPHSCLSSTSPQVDRVNGAASGNSPISGLGGLILRLFFTGFAPNSPVRLLLFSTPTELATVTANADGVVDSTVTLPAASAGVHTLELQGTAPGGGALHKRLRIQFPGRPTGGGSYATYLCCFTPSTAADGTTAEQVDILYFGDVINTVTPDEDGGVFVELPVLDMPEQNRIATVTARSRTTGKILSTSIDPIPSVPALWATSTTAGALSLTGANLTVKGLVHSNADLAVTGLGVKLSPGAEYATKLTVSGPGASAPGARKVSAGGLPAVVALTDYRPGGPRAVAAGTSYHAIPASSCVNARWTVAVEKIPAGVVYVPCAVVVTGSGSVRALIVAEGTVTISSAAAQFQSPAPGIPALVTGASGSDAVRILGANVQIRGTIQALSGGVSVAGLGTLLRCGVLAATIKILGAGIRVETDSGCIAA